MSDSGKEERNESTLSEHKRFKKELIPPLAQIPSLSPSSWLHDRLPEMLWAILVIGNIDREKALEFFRYIAKYVSKNQDFYDITLSGIETQSPEKIKDLIAHMMKGSKEIPILLRPLLLFPELPAHNAWKELLPSPIPEEDWTKVMVGVGKTYDHQSQESTDCRWVKMLCQILGGHLKLPNEKAAKEILEYPNYGDMAAVRPTIRATEIFFQPRNTSWSKHFWKYSYSSTQCIPEETKSKRIELLQKELAQDSENRRKHLIQAIRGVRNDLIEHFFKSIDDTKVDSRRENSFGLTLYALTLCAEIELYHTSFSIIGRSSLRSLIEIYITFKYLLKKEKEEPKIWEDFHSYGTGQSKLIYLKLKEIQKECNCINIEHLNTIVNEDIWSEFTPICLGQWGDTDLRKMSEYANAKEDYDLYYNYTSGFVHGTRGAIRESIYQFCLNPLHRSHRIPIGDMPLMPSVSLDSIKIVNKILECLNEAYPDFKPRITLPVEKEGITEPKDKKD